MIRKNYLRSVILILLASQFRAALSQTQCTAVDGTPLPSPLTPDGAGLPCVLGSAAGCTLQATRHQRVCFIDGQLCPKPTDAPNPINGIGGHFISASISWRATGGNSVEFEVMSTWRYSFLWPSENPNTYTGPCGFPGIGDKVPIVGTSADQSIIYGQQVASGIISQQLFSGPAPTPPAEMLSRHQSRTLARTPSRVAFHVVMQPNGGGLGGV